MTTETVADTTSVDRSKLLQRVINSGARVVTVTAAAGYGKSRFARSIMEQCDGTYVADCGDMVNVAAGVRVLSRALGPFDRDFEERLGRLILALPQDSSADDRWRDVLDEALERADASAVLFVENGEFLAERPLVAELVDRALRHGPRRAVLCSRVPLALMSLSRIPPNECYAVDASELRFTDEEVCALFVPLEVSNHLLERVVKLARGWPIAVLTLLRAAHETRLEAGLTALEDGSGVQAMADYMLTQGLGSLSLAAREVLAAAAILGRITDGDLAGISADHIAISLELDLCPFISRIGGAREIHPLASAALASMRTTGERALLRAASAAQDPVHAAQLFIAAGHPDRAADVLDTSVAPFMMEEPTPEIAAIVASLGESVLLRHPATWNATWMNRGYTVPSQRMLFESRTVWAALTDDAPLAVRFGVGLSLLNWLFFLGHIDETEPVFQNLENATCDQPADSMMRLLIAAHRELASLRRGRLGNWETLEPRWDAVFSGVPMVSAMAQYAVKGPFAFFRGKRGGTRRAFALGVDLASTANSETVHVIAIKNAAFFAWLAGDSEAFESLVDRLRSASAPNVVEATRHFLGCATSNTPSRTPLGFELPIYRAYAWFVAAGREKTLERRRAALRAAIDAAAQDGQPWIKALAWAALGLADASLRSSAFERAQRIAASVEYPAFRGALDELMRNRIPKIWAGLRVLADVEPAAGRIVIGLASRELHVGSHKISLAPREAELLLALALHATPRDRSTLAAMIWPDVEERNSSIVGVYVARLRRRLGNLNLIESRGSGYGLTQPVMVDLLLLEESVQQRRVTEPFEPWLEELVATSHLRLPQWVLTSSWLAPYTVRLEEAIRSIRAGRAAEAEQRGDVEVARHYLRLLAAEEDLV